MTEQPDHLEAIASAADELIPQLAERLRRHGLGEIEVASGDFRLLVSMSGEDLAARAAHATTAHPSVDAATVGAGEPAATPATPQAIEVASPAVGFFVCADGLGPGLEVSKGDALGHVEMLGVRHEVRAPRAGTVSSLVAESGEAVEYGQTVVELLTPDGGR